MTATVYNMREGQLSWVSASGNGNSFATAESSPSGVSIAYVRDFSFTSAQTINTVMNRGTPHHHKKVDAQPISLNVTYGFTGEEGIPDYPVHLQFKVSDGTNSAFYVFNNAYRSDHAFTEAAEENSMADTFVALGYIAATASGYLG